MFDDEYYDMLMGIDTRPDPITRCSYYSNLDDPEGEPCGAPALLSEGGYCYEHQTTVCPKCKAVAPTGDIMLYGQCAKCQDTAQELYDTAMGELAEQFERENMALLREHYPEEYHYEMAFREHFARLDANGRRVDNDV